MKAGGNKREGLIRGRLRRGAFFGEVSLLQNSAAGSEVIVWRRPLSHDQQSDFFAFS